MASRDGHSRRKALIKQFCSVTGADKTAAKKMLEICNYNVEVAINMHVEADEADEPSSTSTSASGATVDSSSTTSRTVVDGASSTTTATMADDDDDVRAPIPPMQGVLVGPGYSTTAFRTRRRPPRSVFDGFRDFEAETRQQEQELYNSGVSGSGGVIVIGGVSGSTVDHGGGGGGAGASTARQKRKTLEDLFRPPLDVMHKGTFDSARDFGQTTNRWLMVNIQNVQEFPCQVLNRDVWSNESVKSIIREHFVFWQVYHDSEEGERYMQFYKIHEWPYVAIIDPRTGENMISWTKLDSISFFDLVTEFLTAHPSLDGSLSTMTATAIAPAKRQRLESILDASEDSQMEAAIKASLIETVAPVKRHSNGGSEHTTTSTSTAIVHKSHNQTAVVDAIHDDDDDDDEDEGMDDLETFDTDSENSSGLQREEKRKQIEDANRRDTDLSVEADGRLSQEASPSSVATEIQWKDHLGASEDPKSSLAIRFPDGSKEQLNLPSTSKLKALLLYVESKGFSHGRFELVTNFPKRRIDTMDSESSLKEVGLFPQETVFVQSR